MQVLHEMYKHAGTLHHAYILEGMPEPVIEDLSVFCGDVLGVPSRGNPDFVCEVHDRFLVDHARRLRELQQNRALTGDKKVFIVAFHFITREAQNALLKVLEEPTAGTHIFIVTPSAHVFLPTVLSRVTVLKTKHLTPQDAARSFLKSSYKKRMDYIAKLVKDIKDEKATKAVALSLVRGLIMVLHEDAVTNRRLFGTLQELDQISLYLEDSSASVKMLLEHTALVV